MQTHSLQLKFTPMQALINLASCALNAVYNNNSAANRAEPSTQTHTHFPEKEREENFRGSPQPAHSQTSICSELKTNQSLTPLQDTEESDSVCIRLCDPPGRASDCEQREEITGSQTSDPPWSGPNWSWHILVAGFILNKWLALSTEHDVRAHWNPHIHDNCLWHAAVPFTNNFGWDAAFLQTSDFS